MNRTTLVTLLAAIAVALVLASEAGAVYHPTLGRFLQRDPDGYRAGSALYAYVRSAPTHGLDPSGLRDVTADEIAHWQRIGAEKRRRQQAKRAGYVTQVRQKTVSELCKAECRTGSCSEALCENHAA